MEEKNIALLILAVVALVAITGIILTLAMDETGAYVYRHQPRARPGDWNYQGNQPYSSTPRSAQAGQDVFIIPGNNN